MLAWLAACGILAFANWLPAQVEEERFAAGAEKVATEALSRFAQLVTRENYRQMGFESPEEVRTAKLGAPMRQFSVGLDELRRFEGGDVSNLLRGADTLVYPVLAGERVRSSLTLQRDTGGWRSVGFGAPSLTRLLWDARGTAAGGPGSSPSIVRVPALNLYFIGSRRDGELMLAPIMEDPRLKLEKGVPVPASQVFSALVPLARAHNDLPS